MFSYEDFYYSELTLEQLKQHVKSGGLGGYGERCQKEINKRLQQQNETLKL